MLGPHLSSNLPIFNTLTFPENPENDAGFVVYNLVYPKSRIMVLGVMNISSNHKIPENSPKMPFMNR